MLPEGYPKWIFPRQSNLAMIVSLGVLVLCGGTSPKHNASHERQRQPYPNKVTSSYNLAGEILLPHSNQLSSHLLTVTKATSLTGTTSTVRPWPSHHFFRSVLSKTDNVVSKKSRSKSAQRGNVDTGLLHNSTIMVLQERGLPSGSPRFKKSGEAPPKYRVNRRTKLANSKSIKSEAQNASNDLLAQTRGHDASFSLEDNSKSSLTQAREVGSGSAEAQWKTIMPSIPLDPLSSEQTLNHSSRQLENATLHMPENSNVNTTTTSSERESDLQRFSHFVPRPLVGFQYEIEIPLQASLKPSKWPSFSTPASTTFPSTITTTPPNIKDNEINVSGGGSRLTTAIIDDKNKYASDTSSELILPEGSLQSQMNMGAESGAGISNNVESRNQTTWQHFQLPPTHSFRQSTKSDGVHNRLETSNGGESIIPGNHLPLLPTPAAIPYPNNGNESHTKITTAPYKSGVWTINHNLKVATTPSPATTTNSNAFLPIAKEDGVKKSSSDNTTTTFSGSHFSPARPTSSNHVSPNLQPTHVSSMSPIVEEKDDIPQESTFDTGGGKLSNQSSLLNPSPTNVDETDNEMAAFSHHDIRNPDSNSTAVIRQRTMFTVINRVPPKPSIVVTSTGNMNVDNNFRKSKTDKAPIALQALYETKFYDRTNQLESPGSVATLTAPSADNNDYFDEDDTQVRLHHWIETEQGQSVRGSTELPRFTNLTWPYFVTGPSNSEILSTPAPVHPINISSSKNASTVMSVVSSNSQRQHNTNASPALNSDSEYELYIPSAAADPRQKPILVTKRRNNKTAETTLESWTRVPTLMAGGTTEFELDINNVGKGQETSLSHLKGSDHKSKIKHSHWGSKGLSVKTKAQQKGNNKHISQQLKQGQTANIKVYESSTSNPKSSPAATFTANFHPTPHHVTFSTIKHQQHAFTTPPSVRATATLSISSPFGGGKGETEIASFVTPQTPTNIWYKPIINHFTAATAASNLPSQSELAVYDSNRNVISPLTSTSLPPTPIPTATPATQSQGYVGADYGAPPFFASVAHKESFQGESHIKNEISQNHNVKGPILFKVWNLGADGKLKLQNEREIPPWALQGYLVPASGTILNLKEIPQALRPIVTSAMNEHESGGSQQTVGEPFPWHPLPIFHSTQVPPSTPVFKLTTPTPTTTTKNVPYESFKPDETSHGKVPISTGWSMEEVKDESHKAPVAINYVVWNIPTSIYGQSIILSTPNPQTTLPLDGSQPTPVSRFPESSVTQEVSSSSTTPASPASSWPHRYSTMSTTKATTAPSTMNHEQLELLFQKYFQYFTTTTTPTPPRRTSTTSAPLPQKERVPNQTGSSNAWKDLKQLILRLASSNNKASITLDETKPEDLELLGNVAAIALIISHLQNQYESPEPNTSPPTPTLTSVSMREEEEEGISPEKNQIMEAVYPLLQDFLNSRNNSLVMPSSPYEIMTPKPSLPQSPVYSLSSNIPLSPILSSPPPNIPESPVSSSLPTALPSAFYLKPVIPQSPVVPVSSPHIPQSAIISPLKTPTRSPLTKETEDDLFTRLNSYVNYHPPIPESPTALSILNKIGVTEAPKHGATTTRRTQRFQGKRGELVKTGNSTTNDKAKLDLVTGTKVLVAHKVLNKLKKKGQKTLKKKKGLLTTAALGTAALAAIKPLFTIMKHTSKYWLDVKFNIDFYDLIRKKMLYLMAYRYMPVFMILAFGLIPLSLSFVPLLYKIWWSKLFRRPKYIKVPVPKPYPVHVYHQPPSSHQTTFSDYSQHDSDVDDHHNTHYHNYSPPDDHMEHPGMVVYDHHDDNPHPYINSPPSQDNDPYYAADTTGNDHTGYSSNLRKTSGNPNNKPLTPPPPPQRNGGGSAPHSKVVNSFNYDQVRFTSPPPTFPGSGFDNKGGHYYNHFRPPHPYNAEQGAPEIHVHLHDEESRSKPQFESTPSTFSPQVTYTSYTRKDLQPYPVTKSYELGFDIGQKLAGLTNKHDMQILKILVENKKDKINKLLEMWNLAKYGASVASEASFWSGKDAPSSSPPPALERRDNGVKRRKRRKKKREPPND